MRKHGKRITMKFKAYMDDITMAAVATRLFWDSLSREILNDQFCFRDPIKDLNFKTSISSVEAHTKNIVTLTHVLEEYDEEEIDLERFAERVFDEALSAALGFKIVKETLGNIPMEDEEEADRVTDLQIMISHYLLCIIKVSQEFIAQL